MKTLLVKSLKLPYIIPYSELKRVRPVVKDLLSGLKAFIKPFEAPQRSMKIKYSVDFLSSSGIGPGRVNCGKRTINRRKHFLKLKYQNMLSIVGYYIPFDTIQLQEKISKNVGNSSAQEGLMDMEVSQMIK